MSSSTPIERHDVMLAMTNNYMQNIVQKEKNYEFRRYNLAPSIQRIWFYLNAPFSHIAYICEIDPARTRNPGDPPLPEDGMGNAEFNTIRDGEWERYDYAYRVRSVWRIKQPISLGEMKTKYGLKSAPRGLVYIPESLALEVPWNEQECVWSETEPEPGTLTGSPTTPQEKDKKDVDSGVILGLEEEGTSATQTEGKRKNEELEESLTTIPKLGVGESPQKKRQVR